MKLLAQKDLRPEKGITYSRPHIWRLVRAGKFPPPIKLGGINFWVDEELDAHIVERMRARDEEEAAS